MSSVLSSPSDTPSESGKAPGRPGSPPRATPGRPDSLPPRLAEDTPKRRLPGPAGNYAERKRMKMQNPLNSEVDDIKDPFASSFAWSKMLAEQGQDESDPAADINHYNLAWANKGKKFGQVRKAPALYALIKSVKLSPDPKCVLQDRSGSAQAMIHPNLLRSYKEQGRFVEGAALAIGGPAVITICGGGGIVITKDNLLALYPPGPSIPNNESPCPAGPRLESEAPESLLADVDPKSIFGEF